MTKILFVDDRPSEIIRLWKHSGCESNHEMLPLVPFHSVEQVLEMVRSFTPDIVCIGYGLGNPDVHGTDVIIALRDRGYRGQVIANSGGGSEQFAKEGVSVDGSADRDPHKLKMVLNAR